MTNAQSPPAPDAEAEAAARDRHGRLTKPPGALGRFEELSVWVAACQGVCPPRQFLRPRVVAVDCDAPLTESIGAFKVRRGSGNIAVEDALSSDEVTGAAMALPVLRAAVATLASMATFDEASVSDGSS